MVLPVRERNRLNTWSAIHESAVRRVLEVGLAEATVSAIAEGAGVSMRSFFNYFPTKEDAVLGIRAGTLSPEALARFRASGDRLLRRTVLLMNEVVRSMVPPGSGSGDQRTLVRQYPELMARVREHVAAAESLILPVVVDELAADPAYAQGWGQRSSAEMAPAVVRLAGAITRFAHGKEPFSLGVDDTALDEATEAFRHVMEESR